MRRHQAFPKCMPLFNKIAGLDSSKLCGGWEMPQSVKVLAIQMCTPKFRSTTPM